MNVRELPVWEKPREKLLLEGASSLNNTELLAILLRTGSRSKSVMDLAAEVLSADEGGIRFLADCTPEELRRIGGMGDAKICALLAAAELGRRIAAGRKELLGKVVDARDLAARYMEKMRYYRKEHFICLCLGPHGEIIEETEVSVGDINSAAANPREVFVNAIRRNASCVAFLHNHPSGNPSPSDEDEKMNRKLVEAGRLLMIPVLDHIVIGDGVYASLRDEGMM